MTREELIENAVVLAKKRASAQEMIDLCRRGGLSDEIRRYNDIVEHCDYEISQLASFLPDEDLKILDEVLIDYLEPDDISIRLP